jgi:transposase-like protein
MKEKKDAFSAEELNLITLAQEYSDTDKARALLERLRWPNGPVCPHCQNDGKAKAIYSLQPKSTSKTPARKGVYKCGACRNQFTVTVKTVFEASHIPITKWLMALFMLCSSKKAMSAHQLHRMLGVTYKTAWFMAHRIRFAMQSEHSGKLGGDVEIDETYVGGKGDAKTKIHRKTPVVALVERHGNMKARVVSAVTHRNLKEMVRATADTSAAINTDESTIYKNKLRDFKAHSVVNHSKYECVRKNPDGSVSGINHCESFFSLLKRGVVGSWHHVSRHHLQKYAGEFEFRWNSRKLSDGERMARAVTSVEGRRLTYRQCA